MNAQSIDPARGHEILPHTADAGIRAWAPDLPAVFEEAAGALGDLTAEIGEGAPRPIEEAVELTGRDLVGLAFAWLDELIGLVDVRGAIAHARVAALEEREVDWLLRGAVSWVPFDGRTVRRRHDVKAPTYHRLSVSMADDGWTLTAYLDI